MAGLMISALCSGAGKTTVTLGVLRALAKQGMSVRSAKVGPDYIDPQFHQAATAAPCVNLDPWAMSTGILRQLASRQAGDPLVIEGVMGILDAAPHPNFAMGKGSTADVAEALNAPVVLVLDVGKQAQTAVAAVVGVSQIRKNLNIAGVLLNRVGSVRHTQMIEQACQAVGVRVFGALPKRDDLTLASRHLGLVQAQEYNDLEPFLERAATWITESVDLAALADIAKAARFPIVQEKLSICAPIGQRIAVARDSAFGFAYPHLLAGWQQAGASVSFFSPLANEAPDLHADAVFLPGGYPELYAEQLAAANQFKAGMRAAKDRNAYIYGECGGYMTLARILVDSKGQGHEMLGFLPIETSFSKPKRVLGYRSLTPFPNGIWQKPLVGHEFHYATEIARFPNTPALFSAKDSQGNILGEMGAQSNHVMGSYAHIISEMS